MSTTHSDLTAEEFARNVGILPCRSSLINLQLYVRLDSMEFSQVAEQSFTEDVVFNFGDLAPAHGREGFVQTVLTFTKHMKSISHE